MTPRTCCLSVLAHGVPVCPAGRIDRPDSFSDQKPKVGLPSHSAPQPWLEASIMTTILLCAVSNITPCFSQKRSLQWARADTQARVTVSRWRPWHQEADGTLCFSQNWIGCMWSRPNKTTGEAAAIWPSILWKALSGQVFASSKEAAWRWIVMVCLQSPPQLVQTGCPTKPEHGGRELCPPLSSPSSWARGGALTLSGWTSNARCLALREANDGKRAGSVTEPDNPSTPEAAREWLLSNSLSFAPNEIMSLAAAKGRWLCWVKRTGECSLCDDGECHLWTVQNM